MSIDPWAGNLEDEVMFGLGKKRQVENEMAHWLAHPNEFGVPPQSVHLKRTYHGTLISLGEVEIHLVEYTMPDGTTGRGFVNGVLTWSFTEEPVEELDDDSLLLAYCGWAWLEPALHTGSVQTEFESGGEESRFLAEKKRQGLEDLQVQSRYKIGESELFEYTGRFEGQPVKGAGNLEQEVSFAANQPGYHLPPIYFLLGQQAIQRMR